LIGIVSVSVGSDNQLYSLVNEESIKFDSNKSFNVKPDDCQYLCIDVLD
jgi:hypothetical protein